MSGIPPSSGVSNAWPRVTDSDTSDSSVATPIPSSGSSPSRLPTVNNSNLPPSAISNTNYLAPPVPQTPATPFPAIQQPLGPGNSLFSNSYAIPQSLPSWNPISSNLVPNPAQIIQNDANHRRLMQLEGENTQRRNTTSNLKQVGHQLLEGQQNIQEQVLEYQFMLEHCLESLDHQHFILNGQSEEIALLRAKMRQFEYLIDALKRSKERTHPRQSTAGDPNVIDNNLFCHQTPLSMQPSSPFFRGDVTRVTASKFQPFNPPNQNESRSMAPSIPNSNVANTRLSRPISNANNSY